METGFKEVAMILVARFMELGQESDIQRGTSLILSFNMAQNQIIYTIYNVYITINNKHVFNKVQNAHSSKDGALDNSGITSYIFLTRCICQNHLMEAVLG